MRSTEHKAAPSTNATSLVLDYFNQKYAKKGKTKENQALLTKCLDFIEKTKDLDDLLVSIQKLPEQLDKSIKLDPLYLIISKLSKLNKHSVEDQINMAFDIGMLYGKMGHAVQQAKWLKLCALAKQQPKEMLKELKTQTIPLDKQLSVLPKNKRELQAHAKINSLVALIALNNLFSTKKHLKGLGKPFIGRRLYVCAKIALLTLDQKNAAAEFKLTEDEIKKIHQNAMGFILEVQTDVQSEHPINQDFKRLSKKEQNEFCLLATDYIGTIEDTSKHQAYDPDATLFYNTNCLDRIAKDAKKALYYIDDAWIAKKCRPPLPLKTHSDDLSTKPIANSGNGLPQETKKHASLPAPKPVVATPPQEVKKDTKKEIQQANTPYNLFPEQELAARMRASYQQTTEAQQQRKQTF